MFHFAIRLGITCTGECRLALRLSIDFGQFFEYFLGYYDPYNIEPKRSDTFMIDFQMVHCGRNKETLFRDIYGVQDMDECKWKNRFNVN